MPGGISAVGGVSGMSRADQLPSTHELEDLRHLDLSKDTTTLVLAKVRCVSNRKGVWTLHGNLTRLATIQLCHALDLGEGHEIAVFETVTCLIQAGNETLLVLPVALLDEVA